MFGFLRKTASTPVAPPPGAAEWRARGNAALGRGAIGEAEACYRAALAADGGDEAARLNLGFVLLEQGRAAEAGEALSRVVAAPSLDAALRADAQFLLGRALQAQGLAAQATDSYRNALRSRAGFEEALQALVPLLLARGETHEALAVAREAADSAPSGVTLMLHAQALHGAGRGGEALQVLEALLAQDPDHGGALESRGSLLLELQREAEAVESFRHLRARHGDTPENLSNLAAALLQAGDAASAQAVALEGTRLDPQHADLRFHLGLARLLLGDWQAGWEGYEARWASASFGRRGAARPADRPVWTGAESLEGRSILLFAEQGLGDSIQFLRYLPLVAARARQVVLQVQPALLPLLEGAPRNCGVLPADAPPPATDFQCSLLGLPAAFGTSPDDVPGAAGYLQADPALVAQWRDRLPAHDGPRVGLVWSGNAVHKNDARRSIPLAEFRALAAPGCGFVGLQTEVRESDRAALADWPQLACVGTQFRSFADTAAVIAALDLVITVDTSVAHLAGALGRPVWIVLPFNPDWRWMAQGAATPWYRTARLYRQPAGDDWGPVLRQVRADLAQRCAPIPAAVESPGQAGTAR